MCMYIHFGMYMYVYIYNNNHKVFFCKDDGMVRFLRQRKQTFFFLGWWGGTASCGSKNTGRRPLTWATCRMVSAAAAGNHFSKVALYFFFLFYLHVTWARYRVVRAATGNHFSKVALYFFVFVLFTCYLVRAATGNHYLKVAVSFCI